MLASQLVIIFSLLLLVAVAILVVGSYNICLGLYIKAHCRAKTEEKLLALSFDDGPHREFSPVVLDILKKHEIKAGFFLIGERLEMAPDLAKRITGEGHIIGNHSFKHSGKFTILNTKALINDLKQNEDLIYEITGKRVRLFRPPYGVTNPNIALAIRVLEYKMIGWSIRSLDTMGMPDDKIIKRVVSRFKPGSIVLFHDTHKGIGTILEEVIKKAKERGYTFVKPDELLNINAYK